MAWQDRIEIDPARPGGRPVVRGSRIAVAQVVEMVADGWADTRIVAEFSTLTPEDVRRSLAQSLLDRGPDQGG